MRYSPRDIERMDRAGFASALGGDVEPAQAGTFNCCTGICSLTPGSLPLLTRAVCPA